MSLPTSEGLYVARVPDPQGEDAEGWFLVTVRKSHQIRDDGTRTLRAYTAGGDPNGKPLDRWRDYRPVTVIPVGPADPDIVKEITL